MWDAYIWKKHESIKCGNINFSIWKFPKKFGSELCTTKCTTIQRIFNGQTLKEITLKSNLYQNKVFVPQCSSNLVNYQEISKFCTKENMGNMYHGLVLNTMQWYEVPNFTRKSELSLLCKWKNINLEKHEKIKCRKGKSNFF